MLSGTAKDTAVTAYLAGAIGAATLADFNLILVAVGLVLGALLAILRIIRVIKFWNIPPPGGIRWGRTKQKDDL